MDTSDGVALRATMDEDVQQMSFDAELKVKYGFFSVPVSLSVPVSFSPGIKKGPSRDGRAQPSRLALCSLPCAHHIPKVSTQGSWLCPA